MMSPEEIMSQASSPGRSSGMSRRKKYLIAAGILAVVLVIVIPVAIVLDRNAQENAAIAALRTYVADALKIINVDSSGLADSSTYQGKAFNWLYFDNPNLNSMDRTQLLQRYALAAFYYSTYQVATAYTPNPPIWVSNSRWLSTDRACEWAGIQCNTRERVNGISLESNALTGKIPPDLALLRENLLTLDLTTNLIYMEPEDLEFLGSFTKLESLLLDDNYIYTEDGLPSSLGGCTNLLKLRLSYNLMGGQLPDDVFSKMTKLQHLEIESNFFTGTLPVTIGALESLTYVYMRRNDMVFNLDFLKSGEMKNLFALWLDANDVTGTIPTEVGKLTELASLSLTNGTLTGRIPTELGSISELRRVWLYNNQLTGVIPSTIQNLAKLEVFEVQDNKLVGNMPQGVCKNVRDKEYLHKSLIADCGEVNCTACCTNTC
ncbi:hypothetical protein MHU86_223 [Fragilaria crotonensis]|nr:hypothetical protein MHU86_223 [Fragilaria crotonensis]